MTTVGPWTAADGRGTTTLMSRLAGWRRWPRDTRDTLFQLLVIACTVLPHAGHLPGWCLALTAGVLGWRARLALLGRPLPGRWPVLAALALSVAMTLWTERTLVGRDAGITLLVVLMALKTLELKARRDALVVFFLGFFLVLTTALFSQSLGVALSMALATWGLLTALVLSNMPVGKPPLARAAKRAAAAALWGAPLALALYLLFPRLGPLWGLPEDAAGRTGLSGLLRMGGMAELANDERTALRLRFSGPATEPEPQQLYLRGPVLTVFDGMEWQEAGARMRSVADPAEADWEVSGSALAWEMELEPIRLDVLPVLEASPASDPPTLEGHALRMGPDRVWRSRTLIAEATRAHGRAWMRHRAGLQPSATELALARELPAGFNPRMTAWAQQVKAQLGPADARTLALALQAHIRQGRYSYTLSPRGYGRHAVDEFWFDGAEGFCEHYASAFVVALRAMDVPARIVTGYMGADPPDPQGWRVVRQSHAHAWAEFWQEGEGWLRADPTASVAPERVQMARPLPRRQGLVDGALGQVNPAWAAQWRRWLGRVDSAWGEVAMGWSRRQQLSLLERMGFEAPRLADLAPLLAGALAAAAAAVALWAAWDRRRRNPWARLQQRSVAALRAAGIDALPHHGPLTLARAATAVHGEAAAALARVLGELDAARHGPPMGGQPSKPPPQARVWGGPRQTWRRLVAQLRTRREVGHWIERIERAAAGLPRAAVPAGTIGGLPPPAPSRHAA